MSGPSPAPLDWTTTFVLGGGPSAKGLDRSRLTGGVVLGLNEAAFWERVDAFFSLDRSWMWRTQKVIAELPVRERHVALKKEHFMFSPPNCEVWERVHGVHPATRPGVLCGGMKPTNTGLCSLNLCSQKGAKRIVLFGFDMHLKNYGYWYAAEAIPPGPLIFDNFALMAPRYVAMGIEIVNASPGSALRCFPIISHEEAYRYAA